jgi:hypothetical protein
MDDRELQQIARSAFDMGATEEIRINDELVEKLKTEILRTPEYSVLIEHGAKIIQQWA